MGEEVAKRLFVPIRCAKTGQQLVGRFVSDGGDWQLDQVQATEQPGTEGSSQSGVLSAEGRFYVADEFTGCPICQNLSFVQCGTCQNLTCWSGSSNFLCRYSGITGDVEGDVDVVLADDIG